MNGYKSSEYSKNTENRILDAIIQYIEEHKYSPTVREIGDMVGLKSPSSVQAYLKRMLDKGLLESDASFGSPRAIRVPGYIFVKGDDRGSREVNETT